MVSGGKEMKSNTFEAIVGAVVIFLAVVFLFVGFSSMKLKKGNNYNLSALFNRIDGIKLGSDIRMSGIKIGTVTKQELDNSTFEAKVFMSIDSKISIPDDSSAKITTDGLLGGNYISIEPGGSDIYLSNNEEIFFTQGAVDLIGLVGEALFSVEGKE
jgi:phospholipid/cholesterol/gamma-HCH transport system substrate-binding protein|tara:strand:+ start:72 stop:542 length:471 start_codon:yes stop_codon:yes gene_type:complete